MFDILVITFELDICGFFCSLSLSPLYAEILWDFSHELHEFNTHGMLGIYKKLCGYVCMCVSAAFGCAVVWESLW